MNPTSLSNLGDLKPGFEVDVDVHIDAPRSRTDVRAREDKGEDDRT